MRKMLSTKNEPTIKPAASGPPTVKIGISAFFENVDEQKSAFCSNLSPAPCGRNLREARPAYSPAYAFAKRESARANSPASA